MSGYEFVPVRHFHIPPNAVKCGNDLDGSEIYTGICHHNGDDIPCKIVPRRREAYVSYDGREIRVNDFKVLVQKSFKWVTSSNGNVPRGALPAGRTRTGESLYIGRAKVNGCTVVGKVHPSHKCLYVPFNGLEVRHPVYEVLSYE